MLIGGRPSGLLPPPDTQARVCPTAEACSTTEDGAEPLLCPSGYECHILSPGDVAEGIPNRGQCVKQRRQAGECGRPSHAPGPCPVSLDHPTWDTCPREEHQHPPSLAKISSYPPTSCFSL